MMTVTRKREGGGSSQTLEKKWRSQTLEEKNPPPFRILGLRVLGFRVLGF